MLPLSCLSVHGRFSFDFFFLSAISCIFSVFLFVNYYFLPLTFLNQLCLLPPLVLSYLLHVMPKAKLDHPKPRGRTLSDPLAAALLPPLDESPIQREVRLKAEVDAKKVSDSIDEEIRRDRINQKRSKAEVNVLLLGQSESGKSTTLKRELLHNITQFPTMSIPSTQQ